MVTSLPISEEDTGLRYRYFYFKVICVVILVHGECVHAREGKGGIAADLHKYVVNLHHYNRV